MGEPVLVDLNEESDSEDQDFDSWEPDPVDADPCMYVCMCVSYVHYVHTCLDALLITIHLRNSISPEYPLISLPSQLSMCITKHHSMNVERHGVTVIKKK